MNDRAVEAIEVYSELGEMRRKSVRQATVRCQWHRRQLVHQGCRKGQSVFREHHDEVTDIFIQQARVGSTGAADHEVIFRGTKEEDAAV
jgi:hypothetical protein